ncbi:hypothetical protein NQ315_001955 [Exocentrus adspersus]|uniref:Carboxylic ester hydrolase n=1 Tax=Exocentrus adspersus TaxID=1586481 RepID=A0AAV8WAP8_9CUCU|nr:hypothetical protein NQ315_001955 [Exocentrus adspersus]
MRHKFYHSRLLLKEDRQHIRYQFRKDDEVHLADDDPTLVTLPEGQIRGRALKLVDNSTYYAFQDIPYASPPVGELRFKEPVAPEKWEGVLNTTKNTKICYQSGVYSDLGDLRQTEDCLYLNVYTTLKPGDDTQIPLPVLVWIHGGGLISGSGASLFYNPQLFLHHNIIIVTINYRLGPLGFLTTEDGVIPGNLGLKDQHFALQWVKKNIKLFGGDPEKVTISGESAGGECVGWHLSSLRNKDLFRAAILQSGTAMGAYSHQDYARFYAFELGKSLDSNFTSDDSAELLKLLQNTSASDITNNTVTVVVGKEIGLDIVGGMIWGPVIENKELDGAFVTGLFHEDVRIGNINQVPIIIGFNSEEESFLWRIDASRFKKWAKYFDSDPSNIIHNKFNMTIENKLTAGKKLREIYTDGTFEDDVGAVVTFFSDEEFSTPMTRHAKLQSYYADVYLYQFSYKGKLGGQIDDDDADLKGVGHTEELPYFWGQNSNEPIDPDDEKTRHRLLTLWTNFVKYLNPTPEEDDFLFNVTWEKVAPNKLVYINLNTTFEMQENPKKYLEWEKIIDVYAIPPLITY